MSHNLGLEIVRELPNLLKAPTVQLIEELTGIIVTAKDQPSLHRYALKRMNQLGVRDESEYCDRLRLSYRSRMQTAEWDALMTHVTNGESYFFRDPDQLALIGEKLLPDLIDQRRKDLRDGLIDHLYLNLWSAGCSTGEEPYSLAMMLQDQLYDFADWRIHLIATDLNPAAIASAKAGYYRDWSLRQIEPRYKTQYFQRVQHGWQINPRLQSMIQWDILNLKNQDAIAKRIPWASMDLILCRNVFIYFGTSAISQVLQQFHTALSDSGYLLVGHAELEGQDLSRFHIHHESTSRTCQRLLTKKTISVA